MLCSHPLNDIVIVPTANQEIHTEKSWITMPWGKACINVVLQCCSVFFSVSVSRPLVRILLDFDYKDGFPRCKQFGHNNFLLITQDQKEHQHRSECTSILFLACFLSTSMTLPSVNLFLMSICFNFSFHVLSSCFCPLMLF